ncbi:MAG: ATP-binding cassette domain-containing protein [Chloroflexi bacterium]|nr:ATP-binding cassette domain-containing protein [Chloroflexota bacterium]
MIEVEKLTKFYGDFPAIEDVSFSVKKGEILGFLGPNAAGKTTAMRILTCFMPPSSGTARIAGYDILDQSLEVRKHIGYLPEMVPLYTDMTVRAYLGFMGAIRGMNGSKIKKRIDDVVDLCRLEEYVDTPTGRLSKGFRQRVGIAQAVLHEPDVLILDEPTVGIDPRQVVETRKLIKDLGKDHTIILSTHILPEVSMVCERVIIINEGHVVAMDRPENLSARLSGAERMTLEVRGPVRDVVARVRQIKGVRDVTWEGIDETKNRYTILCRPGNDIREALASTVVQSGWGLLGLQAGGLSLEEIFLKLTTKEEI